MTGKGKLGLKVIVPENLPLTEQHIRDLDLEDVGIEEFKIEKSGNDFICTFDRKEWDNSRESTGCVGKDSEGKETSDAELFQDELKGILFGEFPEELLNGLKVEEIRDAGN